MDCKAPEAKHGLAPPSPRGSATLDPVTSGGWGGGGGRFCNAGKDSYWILDDAQSGGTRFE